MARNEKTHGESLRARRVEQFGDAPSRVHENMVHDLEAPESHAAEAYMSPRHALEVAMVSEVRAHDFFDQALEHVQDAEVKALFEELRDEEKEHQQLLEAQKAHYPEELAPDVDPDAVDTPSL